MSKLHEAAGMGQSIWLNTIDRPFIHSGRLSKLIEAGVHGVTTHPSDFANALAHGDLYDAQLLALVRAGKPVHEIAEGLLFSDIQTAADLLHPVYERTHGVDGYVSLDINPALAEGVDDLIAEGLRLEYDVDRVNVMTQIPATPAGIEALKNLIGEGKNVNATHIYTLETYEKVAQAYLEGVDIFWTRLSVWRLPPATVATVPVTRLDNAVDLALAGTSGGGGRPSHAGVATAKVIYQRFRNMLDTKGWQTLAGYGSRLQRPLWASSDDPGTVHSLMGPNTVHSLPPDHLMAFLEESLKANTLFTGVDEAQDTLKALADQGVDLPSLERKLQAEAVEVLRRAYQALTESVIGGRDRLADASL